MENRKGYRLITEQELADKTQVDLQALHDELVALYKKYDVTGLVVALHNTGAGLRFAPRGATWDVRDGSTNPYAERWGDLRVGLPDEQACRAATMAEVMYDLVIDSAGWFLDERNEINRMYNPYLKRGRNTDTSAH